MLMKTAIKDAALGLHLQEKQKKAAKWKCLQIYS